MHKIIQNSYSIQCIKPFKIVTVFNAAIIETGKPIISLVCIEIVWERLLTDGIHISTMRTRAGRPPSQTSILTVHRLQYFITINVSLIESISITNLFPQTLTSWVTHLQPGFRIRIRCFCLDPDQDPVFKFLWIRIIGTKVCRKYSKIYFLGGEKITN